MFDQLEKELREAGYERISLEALQDIQSNKVRLTAKAHSQFQRLLTQGSKLFAEA